ncbi:hypothetical protein Pse7429DRAFT_3894, partial [Pseudanabaena biceps PCC 7429]
KGGRRFAPTTLSFFSTTPKNEEIKAEDKFCTVVKQLTHQLNRDNAIVREQHQNRIKNSEFQRLCQNLF